MSGPRALAAATLAVLVGGCASPVHVAPEARMDDSVQPAGADYRGEGPVAFASHDGSAISPYGCTLNYTRFAAAVPTAGSVVLAHGFLRDRESVRGIARHLASWGVDVVSIDLCNASLLTGEHARGADDLRTVARELGLQRVIYAGFSAGALAALLATGDDPNASGALLLDLVDKDNLAAKAASRLRVPVHALVAPPSACNADGNGVTALRSVATARVLRVTGTSHCHFEIPLDSACTALCGGTSQPAILARLQGVILGLATAAAVDDGAPWWRPDGDVLSQLLATGRVQVVVLAP